MAKRKSSRPGAVVYPPVLKDRVKQTQKRIREWGADAFLLTNEPDIRYLTGFHGEASWAIVPARSSKLTVISDSRFDEEIDRQAPQVTKVIRKAGLTEEVKKIAGKRSFKRVALQKNHVSMVVHEAIQKKLGKRRMMYVDDGMLDQRAIKDKGEIALIKKAGQIQCEALRKTLGDGEYFLDIEFTVTANYGDVAFVSDAVHYAWPYVRMNDKFSVQGGARITNSEGGIDQKGTHNKTARWVDYSNTTGERNGGLAVFSHSDNEHPHKWLTRDYGTFGPRRTAAKSGKRFTLKKGESISQRVGVLVHVGDVEKGKVAERYRLYLKGKL